MCLSWQVNTQSRGQNEHLGALLGVWVCSGRHTIQHCVFLDTDKQRVFLRVAFILRYLEL